ncbi:Bax inhibitor-1/YccA family protein [Gluconacetobacter tumulisoli]|uniref:Bax inhibitor-1/YccA family protein n=1 Tax=Gluconacetobacter tumulisoli TaxID=1286189 RepID=A0A7W4K7M3_9PROT|nr:Bax inhibitor-1/YccA family protein [Gluconacetobacter tumulisoli]MBB2201798.1 Bax inhibitor-1/YccA family protein [Gluconacetobacter tumulisoli]
MAFSPDFRTMSRPAGAGAGAGVLDLGLRAYMLRVYNWMASGLVLTGIVAFLIANTGLRAAFFSEVVTEMGVAVRPTGLGMLAMIAPLGFVLVMSLGVNRLSRQTVQTLFWLFCAVMGASLSSILMTFTGVSVVRVFFVTAGTFAAMSIWGYVTKTDLTRFGSFLIMGLFGLVIAGVVNMFLRSSGLAFLYSIVGVFIFVGLTAFDTQRIKLSYQQFAYYEGPEGAAKRSVYDALALYLNFINLFQFLLQFMGVRSNQDN